MQAVLSKDALPTDAPHVPVVIVGAGACGLTAALALSRMGVPALVLERDELAQGSTALSSGFIPACGTQAQKAQGIQDSSELFVQDIQAKAKGLADPELAAARLSAACGPGRGGCVADRQPAHDRRPNAGSRPGT